MDELDPLCIKEQIGFAITNRGELIPCCRCDEPKTINDPEFQKLLAVSKIEDYESVDEILQTKQWKRFFKNLQNNKGPEACWRTCRKNKDKKDTQTFSIIDPVTNETVRTQKR